jgi:uncharacterized protein YabN with tetrapyrrole methylase and pyrophosphatase domain
MTRSEDRHHFAGPGTLDRALDLVRFLRRECPWDARQTAESLVPHLLEETHEVVDAIRDGDGQALEGELGDLLLNLAFQIVVAEEAGEIDADSVYARLEAKMIARHPHLFGNGERQDWETLKAAERAAKAAARAATAESGGGAGAPTGGGMGSTPASEGSGPPPGVLADMARGLDPLTKAYRIQQKVAGVGFDWDDWRGPAEKVAEELEEVIVAIRTGHGPGAEAVSDAPPREDAARDADPVVGHDDGAYEHNSAYEDDGAYGDDGAYRDDRPPADGIVEEVGDLLFAAVNLARLAGVHPTTALARANAKFAARFEALEAIARTRGIPLERAGLDVLDGIWNEVKQQEDAS